MAEAVRLVVGLGNPGSRYEATRHNVGFWFVDRLAAAAEVNLRAESRFHGSLAKTELRGHELRLLKPSTYMNESGRSVAATARYFRYQPAEILIIHDEIDLPIGTLRLKRGGGHGGHNGLRDITSALGTSEFLRMRIGVGHPGDKARVMGHVLESPKALEREAIDHAIERGLAQIPTILKGEFARAMNKVNQKPAKPKADNTDEANGAQTAGDPDAA